MFPPFLISLIVALLVVGLLLYILSLLPLDPTIKMWIRVIVLVVVALWIISVLLHLGGGAGYGLGTTSPCR